MNSQIRRILWTAFGALFLLTIVSATVNVMVLQSERQHQFRVAQVYEPMLEGLMSMDGAISNMLAAARGYTLTRRTEFLEQYAQAIREFERTSSKARDLATEDRDSQLVQDITLHFQELRRISDEQIEATDGGGAAIDRMLEAARVRRTAADFAGTFVSSEATRRAEYRQKLDNLRLFQTVTLVASSILIVALGVFLMFRVETSLDEAVQGQLRRTRSMIASMSEGIMLVDARGRTEYINPSAERMLGTRETGVPIDQHSRVYGFRDGRGELLSESSMPAVEALGAGHEVRDVPVTIQKGNEQPKIVSMSASPLMEDGAVNGVLVTFRDITERYKIEAEMQIQTERAQTLADAGAFFSSNIDLDWVTQAIAERVAEVLGDWAAVILKVPGTNDLRVAAIHHRDMSALGLAWAFVYRQPLVMGEGTFGQPVATGVPALVTSVDSSSRSRMEAPYHSSGSLASLLVMPLRTRGEIIGALAIAATSPENQMNEQKLPLAEVLAERAAVAIENAQLYIEQVEARKKVEDLSRLKDEFLSIASHELRTPVTSIKGYTQLAKTMIHEDDIDNSVEYLNVALDQIDRMSRLILELLDVSRIETGRLDINRQNFDWNEFVEEVVERHRMTKPDREINLELADAPVLIRGDTDRLEQVLGNLIENAVKYSDQSKPVSVVIERTHDGVLTSVKDQGMGIPSDEIGNVFERFHRGRQVSSTNFGGLGLGLYITKQIVDRHDGTIWVESEEGRGTTFSFRLPTSEVAAEARRA